MKMAVLANSSDDDYLNSWGPPQAPKLTRLVPVQFFSFGVGDHLLFYFLRCMGHVVAYVIVPVRWSCFVAIALYVITVYVQRTAHVYCV
jgi:hypothetical protein